MKVAVNSSNDVKSAENYLFGLNNAQKQLTSHVSTRYYRAPEIILMQDDYSFPSDVWSAGVLFGDLLKMIE